MRFFSVGHVVRGFVLVVNAELGEFAKAKGRVNVFFSGSDKRTSLRIGVVPCEIYPLAKIDIILNSHSPIVWPQSKSSVFFCLPVILLSSLSVSRFSSFKTSSASASTSKIEELL